MSYNLETASQTEGLRRVAIDPVSRVEGHGKVTLLLDEHNQVHQVRLHIVEFRGFEKFIQGRPYWEVPVLVQRLCGICPVSHHLAAAKALDQVLGVDQLSPSAEKIRRLMHYGQMLQSHALHFFHLASPDMLFGFESEVARRNIVGVAEAYPDIARQGVLLRKFGQEIIRVTAGKRIHGTGAIPGGVNKLLAAAECATLLTDAYPAIQWARAAVGLAREIYQREQAHYTSFGAVPSNLISLVGIEGALDFYHGSLRGRDAEGRILFDRFDYRNYLELIAEDVRPWSYMKFPYLRSQGAEKGWYKVGPLARIQNCERISTPFAEHERRIFVEVMAGKTTHAALAYHWARMIEMLHAAEVIKVLLQDGDLQAGELLRQGTRRREGVGVIEAPRGTLIHHYQVGEDDLVSMANLIVSTTHNNQAMNEAIRHVAKRYLHGQTVTEGLLNHIEVAIRAFDPCLSCATHALGKMPLIVELLDADGRLLNQLSRQ